MANDHVMIDIETLGTKPGSVIAAIGAVRFDPYAGVQTAKDLKADSLKVTLDISEQIDEGMAVDGGTINWWFQQSEEARQATFFHKESKATAFKALEALFAFIQRITPGEKDTLLIPTRVWGNGANFDMVLIEALCEKFNYPIPWKYNCVRCFRTLRQSLSTPSSFQITNALAHDCLADAIYQAQYLQALVNDNKGLKL